jgi:hypothetical protein
MLSIIILCVVMLSVIILCVVMLSVIMLCVVMLSAAWAFKFCSAECHSVYCHYAECRGDFEVWKL